MAWYYCLNNQRCGPVDEAAVKNLIAAGTVTRSDGNRPNSGKKNKKTAVNLARHGRNQTRRGHGQRSGDNVCPEILASDP